MKNIDIKEYLIQLFGVYQKLLTDKQIEYFKYYYYEDYSLQEISQLLNVSRNAVYDQVTKVEKHLLNYEEKLHIYKKSEKRLALIEEIKATKNLDLLDDMRKLDE